MSQGNVEAFQGGIEAYNDQDAEALLNVLRPRGWRIRSGLVLNALHRPGSRRSGQLLDQLVLGGSLVLGATLPEGSWL